MNTNRNNKTEAIRLPVRVVDFLRDMSNARGIDVNTMVSIMAGEWIENEKRKMDTNNCFISFVDSGKLEQKWYGGYK